MIFQSIRIKEGLYERTFRFASGVNLIFSKENSRGKTTLLRFMLYSLGYSIPNTRNIQFDRCEVETHLLCEKAGDVLLTRLSKDYIEVAIEKETTTYILPDQLHELHEILFGTANADILNNILGAIYADQEKGWTLLNRGTAIGSIRFNIEELIRGLSGCDCADLIRRENQISRELGKYRQMFSIAKYRESVIEESGTLVVDDYAVESDAAIAQLRIRQKALQHELKRIDKALTDNKRFYRFIAEMKLVIQGPDGLYIPVTQENIVGLTDTMDFLATKRKMVSSDLSEILRQLSRYQKEQETEGQQLEFFQSEKHAGDLR